MCRFRVLVALLSCCLLLVGCTAGASGGDEAPSQKANSSPTTSAGFEDPTPRLDNCALTKRKIRFLLRDWDRVVGSLGRGDHHDYTSALLNEMPKAEKSADGCPGADSLQTFVATIKKLDERAKSPQVRYALYRRAARQGNDWLADLNWGSEAFSAG